VTKHFQHEIDRLKKKILHLAAMVEESLQMAVKAVTERNIELAARVIDGDPAIDAQEIEVEEDCLKILALHQPVAADLRYVVAALKINSDLESIGDQAVNIAERAQYLSGREPLRPIPAMEELADTAMVMLKVAMGAFINLDADQAVDVCQMDDIADDLNLQVLKDLMEYMVNETPAIQRAVQTIITARCLERVADHATNIAESVVFMDKGVNIKHHCEP